jgi:hypothetical protein
MISSKTFGPLGFFGLSSARSTFSVLTLVAVLIGVLEANAGNGFERGLFVASNSSISPAVADLASEELNLRCAVGVAEADSVEVSSVNVAYETIDQGVIDTLTTIVVAFRHDSLPPRTAVVQIREYAMSAQGINPVAVVGFDGPPGLCR